tara:strand:+ start:1005 stop:1748 length:744 start_codon:yes stop_codon:yes gene_type:complete
MKKYFLVILTFLLISGCHGDDHDHDHDDGHGHAHNSEAPKIYSTDNEYLTNLNLMKGHLWVGIELFKAKHIENAKRHMKHPKSELYGDIIPTFEAKGTAGFAAELEGLALSVENEESISTIENNYQNLFDAIDNNQQFVADVNKSIDGKITLVVSLLEIAAEEYAVGIIEGEVKNKFEYQDALGFTEVAKNILKNIQTDDMSEKDRLAKVISIIDSLSILWPQLVPTGNIDGDSKSILDAVKEIKKI